MPHNGQGPLDAGGWLDVVLSRLPATRAGLRFCEGPDGQIFILDKRDGTIRLLVPDSQK